MRAYEITRGFVDARPLGRRLALADGGLVNEKLLTVGPLAGYHVNGYRVNIGTYNGSSVYVGHDSVGNVNALFVRRAGDHA